MIALTENPAVLDPAGSLTRAQGDALASIDFFKYQQRRNNVWQIGAKRFSFATIHHLQKHALVRRDGNRFTLTMAGAVALQRLRREPDDAA